jgi:hypothetical protein
MQVDRALLNPLSTWLALLIVVGSFLLPTAGLGVEVCLVSIMGEVPCPGCGLTRSLTNLAHLEVGRAFGYHPFGLVLYPLVIALALTNFVGRRRREHIRAWLVRHTVPARRLYLGFVYSFVAFGVVRLVSALALPDSPLAIQ